MGIRKYAIITIILFVVAFFAFGAEANDETKAYYIVKGTYSEQDQTHTVDVYLNTKVYIAAGTFGMKYGETVPVPSSGLTVDTSNFEELEAVPLKNASDTFKNSHQIVLQWGLNETEINDWTEFKLGSFTMTNIDKATARSWGDTPFELLDWMTTDISKTEMFTQTDEDYDISLNREIWRNSTSTEIENGAPVGYYQGRAYEDDEWIDIGFVFGSDLTGSLKLQVVINAYNPKNDPVVYAYKKDSEVFEGAITGRVIYPDGKVKYVYEVEVEGKGEFTIVVKKNVHLTYIETTDIPFDATETYALPREITLLVGDINSDGYIKIPDRSRLIEMFNHPGRKATNPNEFALTDLNGDDNVNLFDLNLLKANINKTY